jgi:hypothetical protein
MTDNRACASAPDTQPHTIGVTGHRPARLRNADLGLLRQRIADVLASVRAGRLSTALSVLSPLAEGADQIVARVALDAGCQLAAVLPFPRDDYAQDFATAAAKAEYRALLALASTVVELDGLRTTTQERDAAYSAAGAYTVAHGDMLLAIWDGEAARGPGGTAQVIESALDAQKPVIWIHANHPHTLQALQRSVDGSLATAPFGSWQVPDGPG